MSRCPVCRAFLINDRTCPNCGVDLVIARAARKRLDKQLLILTAGVAFAYMVLFAAFGVMAAPSLLPLLTPATPTPRATLTAPPSATVPPATRDPCRAWEEVTAEFEGDSLCVRGVVSKYTEDNRTHTSYAYFDGDFFLVSDRRWSDIEGKCITAIGIVKAGDQGLYLEVRQIYFCK